MFLSKKKKEKKQPNIFIEIDLDRRRGKRYPEYNFTDLVNDQKRKMNTYSEEEDSRFLDPDAAEIVKRLEAKYGNKKSKKSRFHIDDFIDKGQGYDLEDPFVDDTDIYDEYLPSTMSTSKGGFYINRGKLDFKNAQNEEDDVSDNEKKTTVRMNEGSSSIPNLNHRDDRSSTIPNLTQRQREEKVSTTIPNLINRQEKSSTTSNVINGEKPSRIPNFARREDNQSTIPNFTHRHRESRPSMIPNFARFNSTIPQTNDRSLGT